MKKVNTWESEKQFYSNVSYPTFVDHVYVDKLITLRLFSSPVRDCFKDER